MIVSNVISNVFTCYFKCCSVWVCLIFTQKFHIECIHYQMCLSPTNEHHTTHNTNSLKSNVNS